MRRQLAVVVVTALVAAVAWAGPARAGTFDDVPAGIWYETPVEWLVSEGITNGTSDTTFSPGAFVDRGQMAAFLARFGEYLKDSPESGFADVPDGAFYDEAVDWLVEHAITQGTSDTTYSPGGFVTRAQMAAFLWRFAGRPPAVGGTPFTDVPEGSWYAEAVAWLLENDITQGTSDTTFSPGANVTRAQMAAFLWRLAGRPDVDQPGENRVASLPIASSGGVFDEGDVLVTIDGLTDDGFVKVVTGEGGAALASLDGAVSDDVEISVSQAEIDGPITVTVPIETVDLDAVDLIVHVLDGDGVWQPLAIDVATEVIDGQMFATFTLPAGVALAPSALGGFSLFAAGDFERIVTRVAAQAVASPTTTSTTPTTTTVAPDPVVWDLSPLVTEYLEGQLDSSFFDANGGDGGIVEFRSPGLPSGFFVQTLTQFGETFGRLGVDGNAEAGTYYITLEAIDAAGGTHATIVAITIVPNALESQLEPVQFSSTNQFVYPQISPSGSFTTLIDVGFTELSVIDLSDGTPTGVEVGQAVRGYITDDAQHIIAATFGGAMVHHDIAGGTETTIVENYPSTVFVTPSLSHVVFGSRESDLVAGDDNGVMDAFIWERATGTTTRVTDATLDSSPLGVSDDGQRVLVSQFVEGSTQYELALWTNGVGTTVVDASIGTPALSRDGSTVALLRFDDGDYDFELWDAETELFTTVLTDVVATNGVGDIAISTDGRYVDFMSRFDRLVGDTNLAPDIYSFDRQLGTLVQVTSEATFDGDFFEGALSAPDGSTITWASTSTVLVPLGSDLNGTGRDLFVWTRSSGETQRVTNGGLAVGGPLRQSADGSVVMFYRSGWQVWRPE